MKLLQENFFDLLGMEVSFAINLEKLELNYQKLQMQFHPDKTAKMPEVERFNAVSRSVKINEAYETLKDPIRRSLHLVEVIKCAKVNFETIKPTMRLLSAQMQKRQNLSNAESSEDIELILRDSQKRIVEIQAEIEQEFDALLNDSAAESSADKVLELITELKYESKLLEDVEKKLEDQAV